MKRSNVVAFFYLLMTISVFAHAQQPPRKEQKNYTIQQAISDRAQLHTIAFDGLAFITGNFGADCFFPPGKVADFFGFQYMRDNDSNQLGHNTDFLTRIALNMINILDASQLDQLIQLAKEQEALYTEFAYKRIELIKAFRSVQDGDFPAGKLNQLAVIEYCQNLYKIDGQLSIRRAEVMGLIVRSLSNDQKQQIDKLRFGNSATWPMVPEKFDKRRLSHRAHVGLMTYASELFSWYKGSVEADVYFCPERHGTYFGGFYLKDYPAMGNKDYSISTSLTGDAGKSFLEILNPEQRKKVEQLPQLQRVHLEEIVKLRRNISSELRKYMTGERVDKDQAMKWVIQYGAEDGYLSYLYVMAFSSVGQSLSTQQKERLKQLRNLEVVPTGTYLFSDVIPIPEKIIVESFFSNE